MASQKTDSGDRTSYFRFYEELNDFLPEALRKKTFPVTFTENSSLRDIIESISVPHTEIDLILIDGVSAGFDSRLQGGERVSVYPVFESWDISPLVHIRSKPLREAAFAADASLNVLARKLRLLGFDTFYNPRYTGKKVAERAVREKRIILTPYEHLLKIHTVTHACLIRSRSPKQQLQEVITRLQLGNNVMPFTRCSWCNELLQPVQKKLLQHRPPGSILKQVNRFKECSGCRRIYWRGAAIRRLDALIEELTR